MDVSDYTVKASGTLLDAARAIASNKSRCVATIAGSKVTGVFSEGDLVRALLRGTDVHSPMQPFIHHGFRFLHQYDLKDAFQLIRVHGISMVPVLNDQFELQSVITLMDVLAAARIDTGVTLGGER